MVKRPVSLMMQWQRWLAKISIVLVIVLLYEAYKDKFIGYTSQGVAWVKQQRNDTKEISPQTKQREEKLSIIIKELEVLQEQGLLDDVDIPAKFRGPAYAVEGKVQGPDSIPKYVYSPVACPLGRQPSIDWQQNVTPRFSLDPNKFIYPILKNEPIDQLIGLRQSILLAIRLNRTLALPYFRNHNYGGLQQYNPPIPAALKVNVDILRHFIPVVSIDQLQEKCNKKFDAALLTGHINALPGIPSLLRAQSAMQMQMLNTMNLTVEPDFKVNFNIPTFPKNMKPGDKISLVPTTTNLLRVYPKESSKYKCVVHPFPLSALDVNPFMRKAIRLPNHKVELEKMKNEILYSAIWYYTQPPEFAQTLAREIIEDVMHARQEDGIYNFVCLNYHKHSPGKEEIDLKMLENIANSLLRQIGTKSNALKVSGIYISSPVSKQGQASEYRDNLRLTENGREIPVFSGEDIIAMWRLKHFKNGESDPESLCSLLEDNTQDILSLVEMQVCVEAAVFIRSIGSSWAANVQANRMRSDFSDFDMSMKELLDQYNKGMKKS